MAARREPAKTPRASRTPRAPRAPARRRSVLQTTSGEPIPIVHLAAECWPWARTGGLGEAVASLATYQALAGLPTTVVMPLYRAVRRVVKQLEPVGEPFVVQLGPTCAPTSGHVVCAYRPRLQVASSAW